MYSIAGVRIGMDKSQVQSVVGLPLRVTKSGAWSYEEESVDDWLLAFEDPESQSADEEVVEIPTLSLVIFNSQGLVESVTGFSLRDESSSVFLDRIFDLSLVRAKLGPATLEERRHWTYVMKDVVLEASQFVESAAVVFSIDRRTPGHDVFTKLYS